MLRNVIFLNDNSTKQNKALTKKWILYESNVIRMRFKCTIFNEQHAIFPSSYMGVHKVVSVEWVLRIEIMGEPTNELSHPRVGV